MPMHEISGDKLNVLSVLGEAAETDSGWKRGGVRGWLLGSDLTERAYSGAGHDLQQFKGAGFVIGDVVLDPGRPRRPLVLWRITQVGEDALAAKQGRDPVRILAPVPDPQDDGVIFISHDAWRCLSVLQGRAEPTQWNALVEEVRKRFSRGLYYEDAKLLLSRRLAEETVQGEGRDRITSLVATPAGRTAVLVDGKTSESLVQVRMGRADVD
jgi:hypothetical protein